MPAVRHSRSHVGVSAIDPRLDPRLTPRERWMVAPSAAPWTTIEECPEPAGLVEESGSPPTNFAEIAWMPSVGSVAEDFAPLASGVPADQLGPLFGVNDDGPPARSVRRGPSEDTDPPALSTSVARSHLRLLPPPPTDVADSPSLQRANLPGFRIDPTARLTALPSGRLFQPEITIWSTGPDTVTFAGTISDDDLDPEPSGA